MGAGTIPTVWLCDIARSAAQLNALEGRGITLSQAERSRALAMSASSADGAQDWLATRIALRLVLADAGAREALHGTAYAVSPAGKPSLATGRCRFSLAHAAGFALIAVSTSHEVGIDIEGPRQLHLPQRRSDLMRAAGSGLSPSASAAQLDDSDAHLICCWTRIEAVAKALGCGAGRLMTELGLIGARQPTATMTSVEAAARALLEAKGLSVVDLDLPSGLTGALAGLGESLLPEVPVHPLTATAIEAVLSRAQAQ